MGLGSFSDSDERLADIYANLHLYQDATNFAGPKNIPPIQELLTEY
jgi:hypothetical protein